MVSPAHSALSSLLITILATSVTADLPYRPTRAFLSPKYDNQLLYIFLPSAAGSETFQFLSLNVSSTLDASKSNSTQPFTPVIDQDGNLTVYTSQCAQGAEGAELWHFVSDKSSETGNGTWSQLSLSKTSLKDKTMNGANFLASGMAYSSMVGDVADIYMFGGMCPNSSASQDTWVSYANYSNAMLSMAASTSSESTTEQPASYSLALAQARGPPIAEAGFTVTGLSPTYTNSSSGQQSEQQNFVLLGGHTANAFINMSQVALFSLPEQSWSFLPVNQPESQSKTDLAVRSSDELTPRSGHTAALTSDGKKIVIFGGWVGDITQPADPQLAILELGEGYGGDGEWQWTIPSTSNSALDEGAGIYGHGVAMLPGDVMMITGGYHISASSSSKARKSRRSLSQKTYFLNVTSGNWVSSYSSPAASKTSTEEKSSTGALSTTSQKVGLGAGLVLGFAAVAGVVAIYYFYSRRLKRRREEEKEAGAFDSDPMQLDTRYFGAGGVDGRGGDRSAMSIMGQRARNNQDSYPWAPLTSVPSGRVGDTQGWRETGGTDAERTGLLVEIPSPTRGLRRGSHPRGSNYSNPPRFEDSRRGLKYGNIHPIEEQDEEESIRSPSRKSRTSRPASTRSITAPGSPPVLDPFTDPEPLGSHPTTPVSAARERQLEIQNWVSDWATASDVLLNNPGRISPDKDERTSSTLSSHSAHSNGSNNSLQRSVVDTITRSISQRTAALFGATHASSSSKVVDNSAEDGRNSPEHPSSSHSHQRSKSLTLTGYPTLRNKDSGDTFTTARTSFTQLQAEGESLLGPSARPQTQLTDYTTTPPDSPIKPSPQPAQNPHLSRGTGWMGSMRRVLTSLPGVSSPDNNRADTDSPTSWRSSPTRGYRIRHNRSKSGVSSASIGAGFSPPRRAASSSSAMVWRRKQGARDWDVQPSSSAPSSASNRHMSGMNQDGDGDWDVEAAFQRRVVQMLFTVPRGELRVVNADAEGSLKSKRSDASERSRKSTRSYASGKGKGRDLGNEGGWRRVRNDDIDIDDDELN
ncbi:MAG: hypothetical protein M1834_001920 [Cirrosporium novae-zelandiae]|nr:MAG: hypothetical protein M1834_001920 [Cirrosporium novae-zelandiae]